MKKHRALIRIIACAVAAVILYFVGHALGWIEKVPHVQWNPKAILNSAVILLVLFAAEGAVGYILSLLKPKSNRVRTMIALTRNLMRYIVILIGICLVLSVFGVDIITILAGLGIIALIIGFGAESLIADIVTGVFILIDNQYNIGDIIEINGFRGTVTDISVRTTVLTDPGGNVKIINNSDMKNILNRSDNSSKAITEFPIPYDTDVEALEEKIPELLKKIRAAHPEMMKSDPVYLGIDRLDDSSIVLKFYAEVAESDIFAGARVLNHDLLIGMRKLGVEVPFPQFDVHQK
ncbi:MAG: mechanosensitive ion channel [Clostridia bacterium]|nr:mechanosensitive ion channel [Clostridia bacterium]